LERPIRQRACSALIAIAVLVDSSTYDVARVVVWGPRSFHMPWLPVWPALAPDASSLLWVRAATLLACFGACALYWGRSWGAWPALALYGYVFLDHQLASPTTAGSC
jgi:hypothetical protein